MKTTRHILGHAFCTVMGFALFSGVASGQTAEDNDAGWQICNETSYILNVATAFMYRDRLVSKGWAKLLPGDCDKAEASKGQPRYLYAESSPAYAGGIREWKGTTPFCVEEGAFRSDPAKSCDPTDKKSRMFLSVDPKDPVTTLTEPEDYGRRATIAGLQRLLKNNGYKISRIDGVSGRRTTRNVRAFLKTRKLPENLPMPRKLEELEKASQERLAAMGLKVCNKSSEIVWAAIGQRKGENWESRGWWSLPVAECLQLVTEPLSGKDVHIFARQRQTDMSGNLLPDKSLRNVSATPAQFCITDARFSALGRENCTGSGYEVAAFRMVEVSNDSATVNLTDTDFVEVSVAGLRR